MVDFEIIEHTADIGIRVYGKTKEEIFSNAASALFSLITDFVPSLDKEKQVNIEGQTQEDLLFNWLNELISLFYTYKFLPESYSLTIDSNGVHRLQGNIKGAEHDPYSQKINLEIKAATYHNLKIEKSARGYLAEIIFDV